MSSNRQTTPSGFVLTFRNKATVAPVDVRPDDAYAIKIVAIVGSANDWAAYYGPSNWPDILVATSGTKLEESTATALYWVLAKAGLHYRN